PVMQPVGAVLPELYHLRDQPEAGPMLGAGDRLALAEALLQCLNALEERIAVRERAGLLARMRAYLAHPRAGREIGVGLAVGDDLDRPPRPHLAAQRLPVHDHRRPRICSELAALVGLE